MKSLIRNTLDSLISSYSDYCLIPKGKLARLESQTFAHHLKKLFSNLNIECVIDVGVNTGGYHNFLRKQVGFQGIVLSFEPIKKHVEILQQSLENHSNWFISELPPSSCIDLRLSSFFAWGSSVI